MNESAGEKLWKRRAQNALGNRRSDFHFSHSFNNNKLDDRDHFQQNAKTSVASLRGLIASSRNIDRHHRGMLIGFNGIPTPAKEKQIRVIFEKQPFGELERLVTQKLLDVIKKVAREELNSENWLHLMARLAGRSYEQMRVTLLEFLDTDVFSLSPENCVSFLDPVIESWDVDLTTFGMEIVLNRRIASGDPKRFAFVETGPEQPELEPGFKEFLNDSSLSGTVTKEELELLKNLRFNGKRPTAIYYYRELQSLRDPLHFRAENRSSKQNSG